MIPKKNRLIIFTGIAVLIVFFFLIYRYYKRAPSGIMERLTNPTTDDSNNLIGNGDFSNGQKTDGFIGWSGTNLIQIKSNPGDSNYALKQTRSSTKTYYQVNVACIPNQVYVFRCLVSFEGLMAQPDLTNLVKFNIPNTAGTNVSPEVSNKILKKIVMDSNNTWYKIQYAFRAPADSAETIQIYLNYTTNLQASNIYFTNLECFRVLPDAVGFTDIDGLKCFLSPQQYMSMSSVTKTWTDITNSDNSFQFNSIPLTDSILKGINIYDNKLTGPSLGTIIGTTSDDSSSLNEFSCNIVFQCNESYTNEEDPVISEESGRVGTEAELQPNGNKTPTEEEETPLISTSNPIVLTIPGNDGDGIQLRMPNCEGKIELYFNGSKVAESDRQLVFYVKSVITLVYSNRVVNVFQDGVNVLSAGISAYYPNNDPVVINSGFNWNATLFGVQFYNIKLSTTQISNIYKYFIENSCATSIDSEDFNLLTNSEVYDYDDSFQNDMTGSETGEEFVNAYTATTCTSSCAGESSYTSSVSESSLPCRQDCMTMCSPFLTQATLGSDLSDYQACVSNCKNSLPSCKNYCRSNDDPDLCGTSSTTAGESEEESNDCPTAYMKNGQYTVYIDPNSTYAQTTSRSGEIPYSASKESAAYIYQQNFPNCPLPDALTASGGNDYRASCPFKLPDNNPCDSTYCSNIDWSKTDDECAAEMSIPCKHMVANYCEINHEHDDSCLCWKPENRDKPQCRDFRRKFQDPSDYQCSAGSYPITEHPDIGKYIKRDSIPCWNCNL